MIDRGGLRRVAVFRALQLGDLLCAVPALRALRAGLPSAHITLIGLPWASEMLQLYPWYLDSFVAFPGWPGLPEQPVDPRDLPRFLLEVQSHNFELAIQLHGNGTLTNPLVSLFGARHTAGFAAPGVFVPEPGLFMEYPRDSHEILRLLRLMQFLGFPMSDTSLEFPTEDRGTLCIDGPYVCIHPGARDPARRWRPAAFAAVGDALAARGLTIVLTGTAADGPSVHAVEGLMRNDPVNLCGRTDLTTLADILRRAHLLVCNDTGVSHLAAAVGTPSVVVFLGSDPARWAPLDSSRHRIVIGGTDALDQALAHASDLLSVTV